MDGIRLSDMMLIKTDLGCHGQKLMRDGMGKFETILVLQQNAKDVLFKKEYPLLTHKMSQLAIIQ